MENPITQDTLISLLDRYGWKWRKTDKGNIVTGFQGLSGNFLISFEIKEDWLVIFTADYLPTIMAEEKKINVHSKVLEFNAKYPYVRFAKTIEGTIFLVADVAINKTKKIDFDAFRLAMDLICEAADEFYPPLYELITGKELPPVAKAKE